ncbi:MULTISPECIES: hypothetical protein [unclassified Microcoleus]|uniref:hypothetical protein n=1 Tax=unclassified Microcoleus TaxID=2642155 RepID=UPI002FD41610
MADGQLGVILKMAQTINPQIESDRHFEIDLAKLRQLPAGTLGCEVARFLDEQGFEPIASGDWIGAKPRRLTGSDWSFSFNRR